MDFLYVRVYMCTCVCPMSVTTSGPGHCYRLYSTTCYESFAPETIPEIRRCNLSNTLLYLKVGIVTNVSVGNLFGYLFVRR